MIDRIEQIAAEARDAIAAATTTDALEEARVRYLGRKAELPQLLRGVADLPPEERGKVGRAANETRSTGISNTAPIDARTARTPNGSAVNGPTATHDAPNASALRTTVPTLPGSRTPHSAMHSGTADSVHRSS